MRKSLECVFWPIAMLRSNHTDVRAWARFPTNFYQHFSYIFAWWCFISSHLNRSVSKGVVDSGDKASSMCTLPYIPAIPIESRLSHLWVLVFECVQILLLLHSEKGPSKLISKAVVCAQRTFLSNIWIRYIHAMKNIFEILCNVWVSKMCVHFNGNVQYIIIFYYRFWLCSINSNSNSDLSSNSKLQMHCNATQLIALHCDVLVSTRCNNKFYPRTTATATAARKKNQLENNLWLYYYCFACCTVERLACTN